jgi:hypothetical protein
MAEQIKPVVQKEITLPSGAKATFYRRKGVALINAQRKADGDASRVAFALLSEIVEVDGKPCLMEDFDEMDLFDVMRLSEVLGEMGKSGPTPKP